MKGLKKHFSNANRPLGITILALLYLILGVFYLIDMSTIFIILGVLSIALALGLLSGNPMARIIIIIFAVIMLFGFPIGTILGVCTLYYMTRAEVKRYFK